MNAMRVLVLPRVWGFAGADQETRSPRETPSGGHRRRRRAARGNGRSGYRCRVGVADQQQLNSEEESRTEVWQITHYRRYTEGMLRRYLRLSMESGRVPSLIGRPMFRGGGRVTRYRVQGFDDVVIFVYDVERCLARLTELQRRLLERVALQEHTQADVAEMMGLSLRTVNRRYVEAVDALTQIFLDMRLLERLECQAACA